MTPYRISILIEVVPDEGEGESAHAEAIRRRVEGLIVRGSIRDAFASAGLILLPGASSTSIVPIMPVPSNVPSVVRLVRYFPRRVLPAAACSQECRIFQATYAMGDPVSRLELALAARMPRAVDNHHGWEIETPNGNRYYYYFSDWHFAIFRKVTELPADIGEVVDA